MPAKKIAGRWQPVTAAGHIRRDATHNVDYGGYSTKRGALEAYREMDPLKVGLEREFLAGAPMPVFRKMYKERSHVSAHHARRRTGQPLVRLKHHHATKKEQRVFYRVLGNDGFDKIIPRDDITRDQAVALAQRIADKYSARVFLLSVAQGEVVSEDEIHPAVAQGRVVSEDGIHSTPRKTSVQLQREIDESLASYKKPR